MLVTFFAQFVAFFVPQKIAEFVAVVLADVFRAFDWRAKAVMKNLEILFPEKSLRERKLIMRDTFRKMFLSYAKLMKISRRKWEKYIDPEALDIFKGKKCIIFTIHMGPWDIVSKYANYYGFEFCTLMENVSKFYLWMWLRFRKGVKVFLVGKETLKAIHRLRKEREYSLVILIDRVTSGKHVVRKFMSQEVIVAESIFKLPRIVEGDVYFAVCYWDEKMEKIKFDIFPVEKDDIENQIFKLLMENVKKHPDQWFNFYFFTTQRPT